MKKILLAGILILLFFVGTTAAVSVNYAQEQVIPVNTARENANSALATYVTLHKLGASASLWKGASLSQTPLIIYDQSGLVFSYLFDVISKDGKVVGTVNAAGNKLVGKPIVSIEKAPLSFDPGLIITKASELAEKDYADGHIDYVVFIMGKDQKIGVMVILTEQNGLTHRLVYDIQTYKLQSDSISYPGLLNAATKSSIFNTMSTSSATQSIQNFDTKTKLSPRVTPVTRHVVPVNYQNTSSNNLFGFSSVKSVEKGSFLSDNKSRPFLMGQITSDTATRSIYPMVINSSFPTRQPT
ncbi:MAG: hypothetical protein WCP36_00745 [Methanomicrobiales archaeon]